MVQIEKLPVEIERVEIDKLMVLVDNTVEPRSIEYLSVLSVFEYKHNFEYKSCLEWIKISVDECKLHFT